MGYAGNIEPSYIVPTVIATNDAVDKKPGAKKVTIDDLDFHIGDEATKANATGYSLSYPIRHGQAPCYAGTAEQAVTRARDPFSVMCRSTTGTLWRSSGSGASSSTFDVSPRNTTLC